MTAFTGAALAVAVMAFVLVVIGWRVPAASESVDDYLECVSGCNALYPQEGPSRVACVEGCAKVAGGPKAAAETFGSMPE